jgi:HEPN domain-containing protein
VRFGQLTPKIEKVKEFIKSYQEALRGLVAQLPTDGYILPPRINSLLGKYEVWPCSDAAIVLTYGLDHSSASKDEVIVRDETNQTVDSFMKEGEPFVYFDETGQPGPVRLKFPFPKRQRADRRATTDDFLFVKFSLDTLTIWPRKGGSSNLNLKEQFFGPRFKRISIFGWNAHLGSGSEEAAKDFKAAFTLRNCSNLLDPPSIAERIFQAASDRLQELEKLIDQNDSESVCDFIIEHPEVVRPDYLRAYTKVPINDQIVDLVLLVPGKELPELVLIEFGGVEEAFFTDVKEASQTYSAAEADLKVLKEQLATHPPRIPLGSADLSKANYQFIMGKSSELTYSQKKKLYERSFGSSSQFHTYDDLINISRYYLRDITECFDRFLSVEARLERLGVKTEDDFNRLMEEVDREMQSENIPFTARSLGAWHRLSSVFWLSLTTQDPLSHKIFDWFNRWYGERAKITGELGSMGVMLRGDVWRMKFPVVAGTARIECSRDLNKERPPLTIGTHDNPLTINPVEFIVGLTHEYASTLSDEELEGISNQFFFGFTAFSRIHEVFDRSELVRQAHSDLVASSNHIFHNPASYGLSKWASLQAAEKFIKQFIIERGGTPPRHHNLKQLATLAESLGLRQLPEHWLDDIQCSAEVRYGGINVSDEEAVEAQHAALQVCEHIAHEL